VIRFSAALVVVAIGVLIGGVAASSLPLVYLAIGTSGVALLVLAAGVLLKRDQLFTSDPGPTATGVGTLVTGTGSGQQAVSGGQGVGAARIPAVAGAGTLGGAGTQQGAFAAMGTAAPRGSAGGPPSAPSRAPGAWPPPEPGSPAAPPPGAKTTEAAETTETGYGTPPAAPAAPQDRPSVFTPSSRRRAPMAPPTRADPVVPWADALPTRIERGNDKTPEPAKPVPSWLADVDDDTLVIPAVKPVKTAEPSEPADAEITRVERIIPAEDTRVERVIPAEAPVERSPAADDEQDDVTRPVAGGAAEDEAVAGEAPVDSAAVDSAAVDSAAVDSAVVDNLTEDAPVAGGIDGAPDVDDVEGAAATAPEADSRRVTVVPGVPRYHDEDCILVRFLDDGDVEHMSAAAAEKAGCTPCRACHAEED
jgi:hypothetical protein